MSMAVIIECISWLIKVTDNNDVRWKPEIMKSQIVHWLIVILCASLCGAVHLLQHRDVGINSMSDLK
jgi:hypothetical protein